MRVKKKTIIKRMRAKYNQRIETKFKEQQN